MSEGFLFTAEPAEGREFTIGRRQDSDFVLGGKFVSREHARVKFTAGGWEFTHTSERSESLCNGRKIERKMLEDGDLLQLGTEQLCVSLNGGTLRLLHIAAKDVEALSVRENSWSFIGSEAFPQRLAKARKLGGRLELKFTKGLTKANGKRAKKIELGEGARIALPWCHLEFTAGAFLLHGARPGFALEARNLTAIAGKKILLRGVDFCLEPGEILAVIGLSGQGKSTLLKLLLGEYELGQGSKILINGVDYRHPELRKALAFLEQEPALRAELSAGETLTAAAALSLPKSVSKAEIESQKNRFLELLSLSKVAGQKTSTLSGGEKRRLALAAELISKPGLILLDEPLSGLDPLNSEILCKHLRRLSLLGYTVVLTTHGYEALEIAHKVLVIHEGGEAFFGTSEETFHFLNAKTPAEALKKLGADSQANWEASTFKERVFMSAPKTPEMLFPKVKRRSSLKIHTGLFCRQFLRDFGKTLSAIFQPLVIGFLLFQIFSAKSSLWVAAFSIVLTGNWFALSLSIREIAKEKPLLRHEIRKGSSPAAILASRLFPISILTLLQTLVCYAFIALATNISPPLPLVLLAAFTTVFTATALGLFVSALSKNSGQANAALPILIIPQVALSGALVPLDQMSGLGNALAHVVPAKYNYDFFKGIFLGNTLQAPEILLPFGLSALFYIASWLLLKRFGRAK